MRPLTASLAFRAPDETSPEVAAPERIDPRIPGNKAIWVGIYAEMTELALMFLVYFLARAHHPEAFHLGPTRLWTLAGVINTLIMLTSSFFVARAVLAIRVDRARVALRWLAAAFITGLGYPLMKILEVRWNMARGLDGSGDVFQLAYYSFARVEPESTRQPHRPRWTADSRPPDARP